MLGNLANNGNPPQNVSQAIRKATYIREINFEHATPKIIISPLKQGVSSLFFQRLGNVFQWFFLFARQIQSFAAGSRLFPLVFGRREEKRETDSSRTPNTREKRPLPAEKCDLKFMPTMTLCYSKNPHIRNYNLRTCQAKIFILNPLFIRTYLA